MSSPDSVRSGCRTVRRGSPTATQHSPAHDAAHLWGQVALRKAKKRAGKAHSSRDEPAPRAMLPPTATAVMGAPPISAATTRSMRWPLP